MLCDHGNQYDFPSKITHHCRVRKDLEAQRGVFAVLRSSGWCSLNLSSRAKGCCINQGTKASDCSFCHIEHGHKAPLTIAGSSYKQFGELEHLRAPSSSQDSPFSPRIVPANANTKGKFVFFYMRKGSKNIAQGLNNIGSHHENPFKLC